METIVAYKSIAAKLAQRIADGVYLPGTELPSTSELRIEFEVADGTIRRALDRLDDLGLTAGGQGRRRRVVETGSSDGSPRDRVLDEIRTAIGSGRYSPGSALPPETALAAAFNASRYAVREALAELERSGEIINRPGRRRQVAGNATSQDALYEQVIAAIRNDVQEGRIPPGTVLQSESALCAKYRTSRVTVRRALADLELRGVLIRNKNGRRVVTSSNANS